MVDGQGLVDTIMQFFGLLQCKDTYVGNAMMRGISGGERKRLSTVEMMMGRQRVLIMDEISTGLDAATLFAVICWLRAMTHHLGFTTVISLLQPPPEVFALFDDTLIMNRGVIVYHGPVADAVKHMKSIGFAIPPRKDLPSFLQEITTIRGQLTYASRDLRLEKKVPPELDPTNELLTADMDLLMSLHDMSAALSKATPSPEPSKRADTTNGPGDGVIVEKRHSYGFGPLVTLHHVLVRQTKLFVRDKTLSVTRLMQCTIVGAIVGGLWFGLSNTLEDSRSFFSSSFMSVLFLGFGALPQLTVTLNNRGVWFKHREMNLYTASSYAWSMALVQVPLSVLEATIYSVLVYFMIGFTTDGAGYFFIFLLVLCTASLSISSIFRALGCIFQTPSTAQAMGGFILLMLVVNSGFTIVYSKIPPWTIYFYWISPFAYSLRAIVVNEFTAPAWAAIVPGTEPPQTLGVVALESFDFYTEREWIWIGVAFNVAFFLLLTAISAFALWVSAAPSPKVVFTDKAAVKAALEEAMAMRKAAEEKINGDPAAAKERDIARESLARVRHSATLTQSSRVSMRLASAHEESISSTLKFTPITYVWQNLSYYVTVPKGLTGAAALNIMPDDADAEIASKKRLLDNITGYAEPGVLTALMGGSGAGKTTLMDVLAGRKNQGVIHGDLMVNGHAKVQQSWRRVVGYVEQTDIHSDGLTIEESLQYSAGLRLEKTVSKEVREAYVLEVLLVTETIDIKHHLVGKPGISGLSVEQRRRLSIGVELVANPAVVFMDEPTSGLDARSAGAVMSSVRNVANNGRTVMVTIHQPSIEIFEQFDRLVLLALGGKLIYNGDIGEQSCELIRYFEAIREVTPIHEGYNPATWMLEVSGGGGGKMNVAASTADFPVEYNNSAIAKACETRAAELVDAGAKSHEPLSLASHYAVPGGRQFRMNLWKLDLVYWRSPNYTVGRVIITIITGVLIGATWWDQGTLPSDRPADIGDVQTILGSLFTGLTFMAMMNLLSGIPVFLSEREVMYRERAAGMYAVTPFAVATGVAELPYLIVQAIVYPPILYFMIGFKAEAEPFFLCVIIFFEAITLYTYMGQFFVYLSPNGPVATLLASLLHFIWNIFNGFLIPRPVMGRGWWWLNYTAATSYVIYAVAAAQLGDSNQIMIAPTVPGCTEETLENCPTVSEFLDDYFGYKYSFRWYNVPILLVFIVVFRVGAMLALKFINHQRR